MSFSAFITLPIMLVISALLLRRLPPIGRGLASASLAAHLLSSYIQIQVGETYGSYDASMYASFGRRLERFIAFDFTRFCPEVLKLAFHLPAATPFEVTGEGSSTGSMSAVAALLFYFISDDALVVSMFLAFLAWMSQIALYEVAREELAHEEAGVAAAAIFLVPSVTFWSSGLLKESVAVAGLGPLALGAYRTFSQRRIGWSPLILVGAAAIAIVKPYVLFPFILACGGWLYASRSQQARRAVSLPWLAFALIVALMGIVVLGRFFPEFSVDQLGEHIAFQQASGLVVESVGDSFTNVGDPTRVTLLAQLAFTPIALINSVFRPFIVEVRNVNMAAAAAETLPITVLVAIGVWRLRSRRILASIATTPILAFSAVYVAAFSIAVGLTTSNLGTLSRYRVPMMPFLALLLLLVHRRLRLAQATPSVLQATEDQPLT